MTWTIKRTQPKVNLTVRVDPDELKELDQILGQEGITRSVFLQSVISQYIEEKRTTNNKKVTNYNKPTN